MFEIASRLKLRFESPKGQITAEDLWDLPLSSTVAAKPNLDDIAKGLHRQLKATNEEVSFVTPAAKPSDDLQTKFDIVKHIIGIKIAERDANIRATEIRAQKQKILAAMAGQKDALITNATMSELEAMLEKLDAAKV